MTRFIDTHAHLGMLEHSSADEILARARAQGIDKIITVSTDEGSWESNRNIAENANDIYFTLGLHPHEAIHWAECAHKISQIYFELEDKKKCVAIGEIGLDFHYNLSPPDVQIHVFESQLELAKSLNLPVVIHCRDAFAQLFESIQKVGMTPWGGVMHCFTGTREEAMKSIEMGFKISFSGILTFKNAADLRETAKELPDSAILIETDCPFLAPIPFRGKPNEPSYLPNTANVLAALRGVSLEEIARLTSKNAIDLFGLE